MKKNILLTPLLLAFSFCVHAQTAKYFTRTAHVDFFSHTPVEDIKADNNQVSAILDIGTGDFAFTCLINSFEFEKKLMQEHFNENYMESDKYPKSIFKGKIKDLTKVNFTKDGEYPVVVTGNLTMKDKTNAVEVPGTIIVKGGKITARSTFKLRPEDCNVQVPSLVKDKIAKELEINVEALLEPLNK